MQAVSSRAHAAVICAVLAHHRAEMSEVAD